MSLSPTEKNTIMRRLSDIERRLEKLEKSLPEKITDAVTESINEIGAMFKEPDMGSKQAKKKKG